MWANILEKVCKDLAVYLNAKANENAISIQPLIVKPGNIATADVLNNETPHAVIATVVKWNEDSTLRNSAGYLRTRQDVALQQAPLQFFVLFTVSYNDYIASIQVLENLVYFFQQQPVFTHSTGTAEVRVIAENVSLSFEEMHFLWGTLGGRQQPSALYRLRLT